MNNSIKKGVVVAVILLFVSVSVIPSTGDFARERYDSTENLLLSPPMVSNTVPPDVTIILNGTMGANGWYFSCVNVSFIYDPEVIASVHYKVDGEEWTVYIEPFVICEDGLHTINYYAVDMDGNQGTVHVAEFKIDKTPPTIDLTWESPDNVHVDFTATCSDATSGMDYVEFYLNDVLMFTDNTAPYEWSVVWPPPLPSKYSVKGFIFGRQFDEQNVTFYALLVVINENCPYPFVYATAYDMAGNSKTDYPPVISSTSVSVHMFERLTFPNDYKGKIGFFFIDAEFEEGPL